MPLLPFYFNSFFLLLGFIFIYIDCSRYFTFIVLLGKKLVGEGAQETTNVTFVTVEKVSKRNKSSGPLLPVFQSDATKVVVKGMGLKKAFLGKQNQFQVNASDAGWFIFR